MRFVFASRGLVSKYRLVHHADGEGRPFRAGDDFRSKSKPAVSHGANNKVSKLREESVRKVGSYTYVAIGALMALGGAAGQASAADKYVVGVSNTLIGNGWREEMVCSVKAEALASGKVSKVILANRNGGPSEQIADLRNLISAGANVIIITRPTARRSIR